MRRVCCTRRAITAVRSTRPGSICAASWLRVGGSVDDIVTMTVYTTERRWGEIFTDMRKEVFKTGYPSSAFMEARKLKTPGAMIEIQAIAVVKE